MKNYLTEAKKIVPDIAGILIALASLAFVFYFGKLLNSNHTIPLSDYIQLLILIFIAGTMGTAIWGHIKNSEFSRSAAYLENSIELINRARNVLKTTEGTLTNNRVSWVTAARLITRAQHISSKISVQAHQEIFEAEHDYQRHTFGNFLKHKNKPLSEAFFCGAEFSGLSIGEAINHPSQGNGSEKWIPTRIISVIYRFFQYPQNYEDPLESSIEFENHEIQRLWNFGERGVCDYVTFRKHFRRIGNNTIQLSNGKKVRDNMTTNDINQAMLSLSGLEK
ncbi:hypothetical protein DFO61_2328 [Ectopseudomonas oleovorans]|uniref:Uncharacterized protein n=2 Tax=Ectopseudomonas oleovorans TaxID=301 RepID=A0A397ND74_ECTOL|nr:hypothetical protein DFO61_2328 [Pseudomonas oleovorans]